MDSSLEEPRTILTPYPLHRTVSSEARVWIFHSSLDLCSGVLDDFASLLQLGGVPETELKMSRLRVSQPFPRLRALPRMLFFNVGLGSHGEKVVPSTN